MFDGFTVVSNVTYENSRCFHYFVQSLHFRFDIFVVLFIFFAFFCVILFCYYKRFSLSLEVFLS